MGAHRESEIRTEKATSVQRGLTVDDAIRGYEKEVSVHKRRHKKEAIRLATIGRMPVDSVPLGDWRLADVTPDISGPVATLLETKNRTKRAVPLSSWAAALLQLLPAPEEAGTVFGVTAASRGALFSKSRTRAISTGGTFHDTRHFAITKLAKKLNVLDWRAWSVTATCGSFRPTRTEGQTISLFAWINKTED